MWRFPSHDKRISLLVQACCKTKKIIYAIVSRISAFRRGNASVNFVLQRREERECAEGLRDQRTIGR